MNKPPILMNFFAITDGSVLFMQGQLSFTFLNDLSFKSLSTYQTIKSMINLYRSRSLQNQKIQIQFDDNVYYMCTTDRFGGFKVIAPLQENATTLTSIQLPKKQEAVLMRMFYKLDILHIESPHIVISDIDDTVLHSFISHKIKKIRTLLFTKMEKRKAVIDIKNIVKEYRDRGYSIFYLSNSEQNLFPLIASFLRHNEFPHGPVLLKHLRKVKDLILNRKNPKGNLHKLGSLKHILEIFNQKKFILIGDNTQQDLSIYLTIAKEHPKNIKYIVIREVKPNPQDHKRIEALKTWLTQNDIKIHYARSFDKIPF